ncbi:LysR family transcriptional regulator [Janthinobacterium svalbardensis]|uniref:LysR family transcriptional regulator n=1 Tax=Janthinobacterium svalbardensis TaxID=368607 RepID=A0A290WZ52_9BURK|nr:LysR family transcriptional regulator [Janthinobacterium svalbardensis]ATD62161.1 LysR family transcriptional regulator [Janthinobacterium svalbardensis]
MNKKVIIDHSGQVEGIEGVISTSPLYLPGLLTFEAAARHLNFARTAAEIGVTPTAVSRTIKNLEAQLNVRLFNRTTRSVGLTEAGASLNATLAPALALIRNSLSQALLATDQPSGMLRVSSSYVAYHILIEPHMASFLEQFPLINVEISLDNQLTDIVSAGFDIGIRMGRKLQNDMISVQLGTVQKRIVVAAPDYFRERSEPQTLAELLKHNCLRQRYCVGGRLYEWKFEDRGQMVQIEVQGRNIFDEMRSVLDAAIQGQGIAFILEDFAKQELASGMLRQILSQHWALDDAFHLYYPHREHMPGKLRAFVDFMRAANQTKTS